jgi:hypothetical protein
MATATQSKNTNHYNRQVGRLVLHATLPPDTLDRLFTATVAQQ